MGQDVKPGSALRAASLPALIAAVLTAALVIGGSWWIDQQQAQRDRDVAFRAMSGNLMAGVATARGALQVANTSRENAERMHAMSLARTDRRSFTGTYAVQGLRLRRALWAAGAPEGQPVPIDLITEMLLPALDVLHECAIVARNRLRLPEGQCLSVSVIAQSMEICETEILIAMDEAISRPSQTDALHLSARDACQAQPGLPVSSDRPT